MGVQRMAMVVVSVKMVCVDKWLKSWVIVAMLMNVVVVVALSSLKQRYAAAEQVLLPMRVAMVLHRPLLPPAASVPGSLPLLSVCSFPPQVYQS